MVDHISKQEVQAWCWYLAALHQAAGADGRRVYMPVSYQCTRKPNALIGCATCYQCTKQLIMRALHVSSCPAADLETWSADRADAVFRHVTGLDERLNHPSGLGDDFAEMDSAQFAKVMKWAADLIPMPGVVSSSAYATAQAESATEPTLKTVDEWGRPRCQAMTYYADVPAEVVQCALTAGHGGEHDPLLDVPAAPLARQW